MSRTPSFAMLAIVAFALSACTGSTLSAQATAPVPSASSKSTAAPASIPGVTASNPAPATPSPTSTSPTSSMVLPGEPWIVYEGPISGGAGNRAVRPDGTGDHWLTPDVPLPPNGWQVHPDWSPDGARLAFAADDEGDPAGSGTAGVGTRDLWVSDADGTGAERVLDCTDPCTQADHPAWSPDGRTLAFTAWDLVDGENVGGRLALLDLESGKVQVLLAVDDDRNAFAWPRWSPDGRRLVVEVQTWSNTTSDADMTRTAIGMVDLDAETPSWEQLTDWELWATYPDWHPDEDLIVFSTRPWADLPDGPSNLYLISPDGSGMSQVTDNGAADPRAVQPTWTPDGTRIMFTKVVGTGFGNPTMMTILPDGTGIASATASGELFGTHPRLRPLP